MDLRGNEVLTFPDGLDARSSLTDLRLGHYAYGGDGACSAPDTPPPAVLASLLECLAQRTALRCLTLTHSRLGRALPEAPFSAPSAFSDMAASDSEEVIPSKTAVEASGALTAESTIEPIQQHIQGENKEQVARPSIRTEEHAQDGAADKYCPEIESDRKEIEQVAAANSNTASEAEAGIEAEEAKADPAVAEAAQAAEAEVAEAAAAMAAAAAAAIAAAEGAARTGPCRGLGRLTQLGSLDLSSNQLVWLPVSLTAQLAGSLRRLDLCDNCLAVVPEGVGALVGLEELALGRNLLFFFPARELAGLTRLQRLDLSWNRLSSLLCPGQGGQSGAGMEAMTALTSLNVQVRMPWA